MERTNMRMLFKQRLFSWLDSYDIYDEDGNTLYTVKGQLSWGHCLKIYDAYGNECGMVKEEVFTFRPCFRIWMNGQEVGTIRKEFSLFKPRFEIDFNGWYVEGSFMEWEYTVLDAGGMETARVSKELFHMTDTYVIDTVRDEDALAALALVLAIDAEKCSRN